MSRIVEKFTGIVTKNDGDLAVCKLFEDEIYIEDMHIGRQDDENPEQFLRIFPAGRELEVEQVVSPTW
jgi:hypothetical protein